MDTDDTEKTCKRRSTEKKEVEALSQEGRRALITRYCTDEMSAVWTEKHKFATWLRIEIAICQAWSEQGRIPSYAVARLKEKASFDIDRIKVLEEETRHDVVAFLQNISETVGDDSPYLHLGVTSSDIVDTALSLLMVESLDLINTRLSALLDTLKKMALLHRGTLIAGRTHGVHGEPTSFGLKLLLWYDEIKRHQGYLPSVREEVAVGKISGAVGTYATVDPAVEMSVCRNLGLTAATISTQILQRERHGRYVFFLSLLGCTIEKIATELRHLQRTEVLEAAEGFGKKQTGSSAMPHKKNPVSAENLCGLSRVLRGNLATAMEDIPLWHERDISHSSAERIILPDSSILADYMLTRLTRLLQNLDVYPDRMRENLEMTRGLVFSQRVMLALIEKGMDRESAYRIVQDNARKVWADKELHFHSLLKDEEIIRKNFDDGEFAALFDYHYYLRRVDEIYARFGL